MEVANVAGGERRPPCGNNAGDLDVAEIHGLPDCAALGGETCGCICRLVVEEQDPPLEIVIDNSTERVLELPSATPGVEQLETKADFEDSHCGSPD